MAQSPQDALIAAKEDLLAAYSAVHSSLGRLINIAHNSDPRAIADALTSEYTPHSQSPPQNHHSINHSMNVTSQGHRYPHSIDHSKYSHNSSTYSVQPQLPSSNHPRMNPPPGPSFMTVTPGAPRQVNYPPAPSQNSRQRKLQTLSSNNRMYASHSVQQLETDDDDDDDEDPEDGISEDDHHPNGSSSTFYNPPSQLPTNPTPPESVPGGKKKRVKRERDPNAPKRPASAYILFQNAVRHEMRAANPTADYKELARQIGDRWKNLSEDDKRPWSEAGKLAMSSWNIQNKEYKTSHPDSTSPQNQANGNQISAPIKKRSRPVKLDEAANRLSKKRGRPTKLEKDSAGELEGNPDQFNGPQGVQSNYVMSSIDQPNVYNGAPAHQSSTNGEHGKVKHNDVSQSHGAEYSEEDEAEEEEEEEEDDDDDDDSNSHTQAPPTSFQQNNLTSQISPHLAPTDSDMDEGDDDEGSAGSTTEAHSHMNTKMGLQPNGILA